MRLCDVFVALFFSCGDAAGATRGSTGAAVRTP
jgi:hypothetical protein